MTAAQTMWLNWIEKAFPELETRAYFVPPVYITRVPTIKNTFAVQDVFVLLQETEQGCSETQNFKTPSVQESDMLDDEAFQRLVLSLKTFSKVHQEVFMCLIQLPFGSYLGLPTFATAAAHLPVSCNLPEKWHKSWKQGDFDVLLIHKQYGFVICEVKAMAYNTHSSKEERRKQMAKTLKEAKTQLDKAEAMLSHLVSDIAPDVRITKTIVCPNLTSYDIQQIMCENQQLQQVSNSVPYMVRCVKYTHV